MDAKALTSEADRLTALAASLRAAGGPRAKRTARTLERAVDSIRAAVVEVRAVHASDLELPPPSPRGGNPKTQPRGGKNEIPTSPEAKPAG